MNTGFPHGVVPTTASDCPRPWFMHHAVDPHHQPITEGYHLPQPQLPTHSQASRPPSHNQIEPPRLPSHSHHEQSRLPNHGHHEQQRSQTHTHHGQQRVGAASHSQQPRVQHDPSRIPSPVQLGMPRMLSHSMDQARMSGHPYSREQAGMNSHPQNEPIRVPSRSQLEQPRIPSPSQHAMPSMTGHGLREQQRIPSPSQHGLPPMSSHSLHEQPRIPSPAQHGLPPMAGHGLREQQPRIPSPNQHGLTSMGSHNLHEQPRVPSRTHLDQSRIPSPAQHDHPEMSTHSNHGQPRIGGHAQAESTSHPQHPQPHHEQSRHDNPGHQNRMQQGHGSQDQPRMSGHTSHEQLRMSHHNPIEQPRMPGHSSHDQPRMPSHGSHDQPGMGGHGSHEQPRIPSRSQHDSMIHERQSDHHAKQPSMDAQRPSGDQPGCLDIQTISETIRQMTKQHGVAVTSGQNEYFPLPLPLCSLGQGLPQFPKPTQGLLPYLPPGGFKPTDTPLLKCTHCTEMFATPVQLQSHMIGHYEMALRSLPASAFSGDGRGGDMPTVIKTEKDANGHPDQFMNRKDMGWKDMNTNPAAATKSGGGHLGQPVSMETDGQLPTTSEQNVNTTQKPQKPKAEKKHECATCNKRFTRTDHLKRHVMKSHPEVIAAGSSGMATCTPQHLGLIRNDPTQILAKKNEGQHQCFICGKRFKRTDHLKRHMAKSHADLLPTESSRSLLMRFDIRAMYGDAGPPPKPAKPRPPPVVPVYTESEKLEKRHVCITCEKRFKRQDHLKRHMTIHSEEKPYNCVLCGKGFRREHHVQRHERTHTGEKPYECVTCGKKFARIDHMKKHNKSHLFDGIRKPGQKLNPALPSLNVPVSQPMCEEIPNIS